MQILEVLFFAAIAVFVIIRLISILGSKQGIDPSELKSNVVPLKPDITDSLPLGPALVRTYQDMRALDPSFDIHIFLENARKAFHSIVQAYANGNLKLLKILLAKDLYLEFFEAIDQRNQQKQTLETTINDIETITISDLRLDGAIAQATVRIVSEQTHILKDENGNVIEGLPDQSEQIIDIWTFEKNMQERDPTWILVSTGSDSE